MLRKVSGSVSPKERRRLTAIARSRKYRAADPEAYRAKMREYQSAWRADNKARVAAIQRKYQQNNRAKVAAARRKYRAKNREAVVAYEHRRSGMPTPTRARPLGCEICGRSNGRKLLALDHNHSTNQFRGWLCSGCNQGLGMFKDDKILLAKAIAYLSKETK